MGRQKGHEDMAGGKMVPSIKGRTMIIVTLLYTTQDTSIQTNGTLYGDYNASNASH